MYYVEKFYDLKGQPWYRAVDPKTKSEAIAATCDQAIRALEMKLGYMAEEKEETEC